MKRLQPSQELQYEHASAACPTLLAPLGGYLNARTRILYLSATGGLGWSGDRYLWLPARRDRFDAMMASQVHRDGMATHLLFLQSQTMWRRTHSHRRNRSMSYRTEVIDKIIKVVVRQNVTALGDQVQIRLKK